MNPAVSSATATAPARVPQPVSGAGERRSSATSRCDQQRAEDVVQETMLRCWRHAARIDPQRELRPWLYTVVRHILVDLHRRDQARPSEVAATEANGQVAPDHSERVVLAMAVREALLSLPPAHREVIVELYFRDRKIEDAARALGISAGTVKSRAYYALQELRAALRLRGINRCIVGVSAATT